MVRFYYFGWSMAKYVPFVDVFIDPEASCGQVFLG